MFLNYDIITTKASSIAAKKKLLDTVNIIPDIFDLTEFELQVIKFIKCTSGKLVNTVSKLLSKSISIISISPILNKDIQVLNNKNEPHTLAKNNTIKKFNFAFRSCLSSFKIRIRLTNILDIIIPSNIFPNITFHPFKIILYIY